MTARRRRKSGSGPSATALIAWVGGTGLGVDRRADLPFPRGRSSWVPAGPPSRGPLITRGRGLAAGTLLACGSVLAVAVHTADNSFTPRSVPLPGLATVGPSAVSGGATAPLVVAEGWATATSVSSGQALAGTYVPPGEVRHYVPLIWHASGSPSSGATLPLPLDLPSADGTRAPQSVPVNRMVAPVAQMVAQFTQRGVPGQDLGAPGQEGATPGEQGVASSPEGAQPAMTMLAPPLLA